MCCSNHYVKSVQIRSFFWSAFNPNTGKCRPEKIFLFWYFLRSESVSLGLVSTFFLIFSDGTKLYTFVAIFSFSLCINYVIPMMIIINLYTLVYKCYQGEREKIVQYVFIFLVEISMLQRIVDFLKEFNLLIRSTKLLSPNLDAVLQQKRIRMYQLILIKKETNRTSVVFF